MNIIFQYRLQIEERQLVRMVCKSKIIALQKMGDTPIVFAATEDGDHLQYENRTFLMIESGESFIDSKLVYIGTLVIGPTPYHVFEEVNG
jgi:hypothetical protein